MKKLYIIGNWKSNKTIDEAKNWLNTFHRLMKRGGSLISETTVILCVPFIHLYPLKQEIINNQWSLVNGQIELAAQNVSPFPDGAYTGEVSASMLKGLVNYCLIGHSERREYFGETDKLIAQKERQLNSAGIEPILCVQGKETPIPKGVRFIAYEPVWAIGSGKPATPGHANSVGKKIKEKHPTAVIIYGGSVNPDNVASFIKESDISGVLPGGTSLNPTTFYQLIIHAQHS